MNVDFIASRPHFVDHLLPVWQKIDPPRRGNFYVPESLLPYARDHGLDATALKPKSRAKPLRELPPGEGPIVTCAYADLQRAVRADPRRKQIFMEHGVGLTFHHPAYAGQPGLRRNVALFLNPNEHTQARNVQMVPQARQAVIGTPKLDAWCQQPHAPHSGQPIVAISFHWDGSRVAPEASNALLHYRSILPQLAHQQAFTLIGHAHPRILDELRPLYAELGIEIVPSFAEVMERADLYVNDCSSTMYEFCVTGKPVIVLNSPRFRRNIHLGIRFWEYSDVGINVEKPADLLPAIDLALAHPELCAPARAQAVADLYPYLGHAAERAAAEILSFVEDQPPPARPFPIRSAGAPRRIEHIDGKTIGILYMGFGAKAGLAIRRSIASLQRIQLELPVAIVGDVQIPGAVSIPWTGPSPFDPTQRPHFQFRAGRVKPALAALTPFQWTLYLDADTEFVADILPGFELLSQVEMAVTEDSKQLQELYNKPGGLWEYNLAERDATVAELGGDGSQKLFNSGVIFLRKCARVEALFQEWGRQWLRWQEWDEQLALIRALHGSDVIYQVLGMEWNQPRRERPKIIFHHYARGAARTQVQRVVEGKPA